MEIAADCVYICILPIFVVEFLLLSESAKKSSLPFRRIFFSFFVLWVSLYNAAYEYRNLLLQIFSSFVVFLACAMFTHIKWQRPVKVKIPVHEKERK